MASELWLIFAWSIKGRGKRLGEVIAPNRQRAWEYARKAHGYGVHVQSKTDYEREIAPQGPRAA